MIVARLAELRRPLAALEALRAQAREVPGTGPGLLELARAETERIRESAAEHALDVTATRTIGIGTGASGPG